MRKNKIKTTITITIITSVILLIIITCLLVYYLFKVSSNSKYEIKIDCSYYNDEKLELYNGCQVELKLSLMKKGKECKDTRFSFESTDKNLIIENIENEIEKNSFVIKVNAPIEREASIKICEKKYGIEKIIQILYCDDLRILNGIQYESEEISYTDFPKKIVELEIGNTFDLEIDTKQTDVDFRRFTTIEVYDNNNKLRENVLDVRINGKKILVEAKGLGSGYIKFIFENKSDSFYDEKYVAFDIALPDKKLTKDIINQNSEFLLNTDDLKKVQNIVFNGDTILFDKVAMYLPNLKTFVFSNSSIVYPKGDLIDCIYRVKINSEEDTSNLLLYLNDHKWECVKNNIYPYINDYSNEKYVIYHSFNGINYDFVPSGYQNVFIQKILEDYQLISEYNSEYKLDGYHNLKWSLYAFKSGDIFGNENLDKVNQGVHLYANWSSKSVEITFEDYDNIVTKYNYEFNSTFCDESKNQSLPTTSMKGYSFQGWYTSADYNKDTLITDNTIVEFYEPTTLYAKFVTTIALVDYESNDNGEIIDKIVRTYTGIYGKEGTEKFDNPNSSEGNWIFKGWYSTRFGYEDNEQKLSKEYKFWDGKSDIADDQAKQVKLFARWEKEIDLIIYPFAENNIENKRATTTIVFGLTIEQSPYDLESPFEVNEKENAKSFALKGWYRYTNSDENYDNQVYISNNLTIFNSKYNYIDTFIADLSVVVHFMPRVGENYVFSKTISLLDLAKSSDMFTNIFGDAKDHNSLELIGYSFLGWSLYNVESVPIDFSYKKTLENYCKYDYDIKNWDKLYQLLHNRKLYSKYEMLPFELCFTSQESKEILKLDYNIESLGNTIDTIDTLKLSFKSYFDSLRRQHIGVSNYLETLKKLGKNFKFIFEIQVENHKQKYYSIDDLLNNTKNLCDITIIVDYDNHNYAISVVNYKNEKVDSKDLWFEYNTNMTVLQSLEKSDVQNWNFEGWYYYYQKEDVYILVNENTIFNETFINNISDVIVSKDLKKKIIEDIFINENFILKERFSSNVIVTYFDNNEFDLPFDITFKCYLNEKLSVLPSKTDLENAVSGKWKFDGWYYDQNRQDISNYTGESSIPLFNDEKVKNKELKLYAGWKRVITLDYQNIEISFEEKKDEIEVYYNTDNQKLKDYLEYSKNKKSDEFNGEWVLKNWCTDEGLMSSIEEEFDHSLFNDGSITKIYAEFSKNIEINMNHFIALTHSTEIMKDHTIRNGKYTELNFNNKFDNISLDVSLHKMIYNYYESVDKEINACQKDEVINSNFELFGILLETTNGVNLFYSINDLNLSQIPEDIESIRLVFRAEVFTIRFCFGNENRDTQEYKDVSFSYIEKFEEESITHLPFNSSVWSYFSLDKNTKLSYSDLFNDKGILNRYSYCIDYEATIIDKNLRKEIKFKNDYDESDSLNNEEYWYEIKKIDGEYTYIYYDKNGNNQINNLESPKIKNGYKCNWIFKDNTVEMDLNNYIDKEDLPDLTAIANYIPIQYNIQVLFRDIQNGQESIITQGRYDIENGIYDTWLNETQETLNNEYANRYNGYRLTWSGCSLDESFVNLTFDDLNNKCCFGDIVFELIYTPIDYEISFKDEEGNDFTNESGNKISLKYNINDGLKGIIPQIPNINGYNQEWIYTWSNDKHADIDIDIFDLKGCYGEISANIKKTPIEYSIQFMLVDDAFNVNNVLERTYNVDNTTIEWITWSNLLIEGYEFKSWKLMKNNKILFTSEIPDASNIIADANQYFEEIGAEYLYGNLGVYVEFDYKKYTITYFDENNNQIEGEYKFSIDMDLENFSTPDMHFENGKTVLWNYYLASDTGKKNKLTKDEINTGQIKEDMIGICQFIYNTYTIHFLFKNEVIASSIYHLNDGKNKPQAPKDVHYDGYIINGWYVNGYNWDDEEFELTYGDIDVICSYDYIEYDIRYEITSGDYVERKYTIIGLCSDNVPPIPLKEGMIGVWEYYKDENYMNNIDEKYLGTIYAKINYHYIPYSIKYMQSGIEIETRVYNVGLKNKDIIADEPSFSENLNWVYYDQNGNKLDMLNIEDQVSFTENIIAIPANEKIYKLTYFNENNEKVKVDLFNEFNRYFNPPKIEVQEGYKLNWRYYYSGDIEFEFDLNKLPNEDVIAKPEQVIIEETFTFVDIYKRPILNSKNEELLQSYSVHDIVNGNILFELPSELTKIGYDYIYTYYDKEYNIITNTNNLMNTKYVYCYYKLHEYNVYVFDDNNSTFILSETYNLLNRDEIINRIQVPSKDHYSFQTWNWYIDESMEVLFQNDDLGCIYLKAQYKEIEYKIILKNDYSDNQYVIKYSESNKDLILKKFDLTLYSELNIKGYAVINGSVIDLTKVVFKEEIHEINISNYYVPVNYKIIYTLSEQEIIESEFNIRDNIYSVIYNTFSKNKELQKYDWHYYNQNGEEIVLDGVLENIIAKYTKNETEFTITYYPDSDSRYLVTVNMGTKLSSLKPVIIKDINCGEEGIKRFNHWKFYTELGELINEDELYSFKIDQNLSAKPVFDFIYNEYCIIFTDSYYNPLENVGEIKFNYLDLFQNELGYSCIDLSGQIDFIKTFYNKLGFECQFKANQFYLDEKSILTFINKVESFSIIVNFSEIKYNANYVFNESIIEESTFIFTNSTSLDEIVSNAPYIPEKEYYKIVWKIESDFSIENPHDILVYATYELQDYSITFFDANGIEISMANFNYENKEYPIPNVPTIEGKYGYWMYYDESNKAVTSSYCGNMYAKPVYENREYEIKFMSEDGKNVLYTSKYTLDTKDVVVPNVPNKEGYVGRWNIPNLGTEDLVAMPKYELISYTMKFVKGTEVVKTTTYTIIDTHIVSPGLDSENGYQFKWCVYDKELDESNLPKFHSIVQQVKELKDYEIQFVDENSLFISRYIYNIENYSNIFLPVIPSKIGYNGEWILEEELFDIDKFKENKEIGNKIISIRYSAIDYKIKFLDKDGNILKDDKGEEIIITFNANKEQNDISQLIEEMGIKTELPYHNFISWNYDISIDSNYVKYAHPVFEEKTYYLYRYEGEYETFKAYQNNGNISIESLVRYDFKLSDRSKLSQIFDRNKHEFHYYDFNGKQVNPFTDQYVEDCIAVVYIREEDIIDKTLVQFCMDNQIIYNVYVKSSMTFGQMLDNTKTPIIHGKLWNEVQWNYYIGLSRLSFDEDRDKLLSAFEKTIEARFDNGSYIDYKVKYLVNGEYIDSESVFNAYDNIISNLIDPIQFNKIGYSVKWKFVKESTNEVVNVDMNTGRLEEFVNDNLIATLEYKLNTYNILFEYKDGRVVYSTYDVKNTNFAVAKLPDISGYNLKWKYFDFEGNEINISELVKYESGEIIGVVGNIYATIEKEVIEYSIVYYELNESIQTTISYTIEQYPDQSIIPVPQEIKGYYFSRWKYYNLSNKDTDLENAACNLIAKPVYEEIIYNATFVDIDGNTIGVREFTISSKNILEPCVPPVLGYSGKWDYYVLSIEDIIISPVYTPIDYTITYMLNEENIVIYYNIENYNNIVEPYLSDGYKWNYYDFLGNEIESITVGDVIAEAKEVRLEENYIIRFYDEFGKLIFTQFYKKDNTKQLVLPSIPDKKGYRSKQWNIPEEITSDLDVYPSYSDLIEFRVVFLDEKTGERLYEDTYNLENALTKFKYYNTYDFYNNEVFKKIGYTFNYFIYYGLDNQTYNAIDLGETYIGDVIVKPNRSLIEYTVSFYARFEENRKLERMDYQAYYTVENKNILLPEIPYYEGLKTYENYGWDKYELTYGDTTIYAYYENSIEYEVQYYEFVGDFGGHHYLDPNPNAKIKFNVSTFYNEVENIIGYIKEVIGYDQVGITFFNGNGEEVRIEELQLHNLEEFKDNPVIKAYPRYEAIHYTVEYQLNNGNESIHVEFTYNEKKNLLDSQQKTGYLFDTWLIENGLEAKQNYEGFAEVGNLSNLKDDVIVIKATYNPIQYTIKFDDNTSIECIYDQTYKAHSVSRIGYIHTNWINKVNGEAYTPIFNIFNLSSTDGDIIELYARYVPITYTVQFEVSSTNGKYKYIDSEIICNYGETYQIPQFTGKKGYKLVNWNNYEIEQKFSNLTTKQDDIIVIKGSIEPIRFIVEYYNKDGQCITNDIVYFESGYKVKGYNPDKDEVSSTPLDNDKLTLKFIGWKEESSSNSAYIVNKDISTLISIEGYILKFYPVVHCQVIYELSNGEVEVNKAQVTKLNGEKWETTNIKDGKPGFIDYGTDMTITCRYTKAKPKECSVTTGDKKREISVKNPESINNCKTTIKICVKSEDKTCIAAGSWITLYDGTKKAVEDLLETDRLLVFNYETGEYEAANILFIERDGYKYYDVSNLTFSNGQVTRIIGDHAFFDYTLNEYVYINDMNLGQFIGHEFAISHFVNNEYIVEKVTLVNAEVMNEYTGCFSLITIYHMNYFVDDLYSLPGGIDGLFNMFEYNEDLKYNEDLMKEDIEKYGLYTYDDFKAYVPYEVYLAFPAKYFKIAVEKGLITFEGIIELIYSHLKRHGLTN